MLPAWLPPVAGLAQDLPPRESAEAAAASPCEIQCVSYWCITQNDSVSSVGQRQERSYGG